MESEKFGRICKEHIIKDMTGLFREYPDFFITTFSNVEVGEVEKLRKSLKKESASYAVVKNSLVKRALDGLKTDIDLEGIKPQIKGSCGIVFSKKDAAAGARLLMDFSKANEGVKIRCGVLDGDVVSADLIKVLAALPPKKALLSMLVSGVRAPVSNFVGLLGTLLRNFVGVIDAISKKKSE